MRQRLIIAAMLALGTLTNAAAAAWDTLPADLAAIRESGPAVQIPEAQADARRRICVDPGHPNSFNTATAMINGTNENRINWLVALRLERILKEKGFDVVMTKGSELEYVENKQRALIGNNSGASLCVHLHCETTPGSGFAVYYPDRTGTFSYKDDPDNGFKGPGKQVIDASRTFAGVMRDGMKAGLAGTLASQGVFGDSRTLVGETQGALTFSIFSKIPTITIEMVVLTNKNDAAFIKTEAGQEKMARAIASGIELYQAR